MLFFPKGTYLVSKTLTWPKRWNGRENWGKTMLRGEERDSAILRLKDGCFTNAASPQAIMGCGGFGSADWFHNLRGQRQTGFENAGQSISIRGLTSENAVPALATYGHLCLFDARLTGHSGASNAPAIVNCNGGRVFLRDVRTTGCGRALADIQTPDFAAAYRVTGPDRPGSEGPTIEEYSSQPPTSPFPSTSTSLRLPMKETPPVRWEPPAAWVNVDEVGADPTGNTDASAAIQKAMDSGASTIFLPGSYRLRIGAVAGDEQSNPPTIYTPAWSCWETVNCSS